MELSQCSSDDARAQVLALRAHMNESIVGQTAFVDDLLIALLSDGHLLVEGAPGLAKTTAIKTLSEAIDGSFRRMQFTPDLLPADLTGTEVFRPQTGSFEFQRGPMFHNMILADEINRAPAKVQSALLEAMGERQVTIGLQSYPLPALFMVMATQNPIEQEGTYALPEAQLDRFLLYVKIDFPDKHAEREVLHIARRQARSTLEDSTEVHFSPIPESVLLDARGFVLDVHMAEEVEQYIIELVAATRAVNAYDEQIAKWIRFGASPRASIALDRAARARAWLSGAEFVTPTNVQAIAPQVLRHRLVLNYEAQADGVDSDQIVSELLARIPAP